MKTRLKIPLIYGVDAVHGHNNVNSAVIFPHNIGLGATRNPDLVEQAEHITALEVAGTGIRWAFAPCVAVAQNERWGRTYESFGSSPGLVSEWVQRRCVDFRVKLSRIPRCWPVPSISSATAARRTALTKATPCVMKRRCEKYLPPYRGAIKAGVGSIMVSYSSWNGQKMSADKYLLTDVLKSQLGFKGFLVSDWAAIDQLSAELQE